MATKLLKYRRFVVKPVKTYIMYLEAQPIVNEHIILRYGAEKQARTPDDWFKRMLEGMK